jgi:site-specific recombinase XerD
MSRHTFATMELTLGADLYVVSKLLGHHDLSVTQIYADIINKKREEAVDLMDSAFENTTKPTKAKTAKTKKGGHKV